MSRPPLPLATPIGLALLGVVLRLPWAWLRPWPWDWDAAYYRLTAQSLARGEGGRLDTIWTLAAPEAGLGAPPDLYWLPLPSRILVPEVLLGGSGLITVILLAGLIGPLTWWLARSLDLHARDAFVAGALAATGGAWIRQLGSTDVYALTAVLGVVALLGITRGRWLWAVLAVAGLALTRNDGFLMGLALAAGFRGWRAVAVGATGPVVTALWWARSAWVGGETFWTLRRASAQATTYDAIFLGPDGAATLVERVLAIVDATWGVAFLWGWVPMLLFAPLLAWGAWRLRRGPLAWPWLAGFVAVPILTAVLAPAVTLGGTLERTGIALLAAHAVLLAAGLGALADRLQDWRGYHPWFTRGALLLAWGACAGWTGATFLKQQAPLPDCTVWDQVPDGQRAFVTEPLLHAWACDAPAALWMPGLTPERARALSRDYRVCYAFIEEPPAGWQPVAEGVWRGCE